MTTLQLSAERLPTPIGDVVLLSDANAAVRVLDFGDFDERMRRLLDRHYGKGGWRIEPSPRATEPAAALMRYFAGDIGAVDGIATATGGTPFQKTVWTALRDIRAGATSSYAALAAAIGRPAATRAVGLANGANPIAVVVPCHRVIGSDGSLTGYGGGIERKRWLLRHEARYARADRKTERAENMPAFGEGRSAAPTLFEKNH